MVAGRVLFLQSTAGRYGSERALRSLAGGLLRIGWHVTIVVPEGGSLVGELVSLGADVKEHPLGVFRRVHGARGWLRLARELPGSARYVARLARDADIVHVNSAVVLGGTIGARLSGKPVVWHLRESFADAPRLWRVYGRLLRVLVGVVIATSHDIAAEAAAVGLGERTVVVHDGIEFGPLPTRPASGREVVTVGRINAWKGQEVLVRAVATLRERGLDVPAAIAGDVYPGGEGHRDRLADEISRAGVGALVRLLGFVDDVDSLLASAGIFVLPSRRPEPFGIALVEAMAHGLPCIATDAGGPRDIVRNEETGLLVAPGDHVALADAIERLWLDYELCGRIGSAAAHDVRQRFGAERMVEEVVAVYERASGCRNR